MQINKIALQFVWVVFIPTTNSNYISKRYPTILWGQQYYHSHANTAEWSLEYLTGADEIWIAAMFTLQYWSLLCHTRRQIYFVQTCTIFVHIRTYRTYFIRNIWLFTRGTSSYNIRHISTPFPQTIKINKSIVII